MERAIKQNKSVKTRHGLYNNEFLHNRRQNKLNIGYEETAINFQKESGI